MANFNTPGMGSYGSTWQFAGFSGSGNVGGLVSRQPLQGRTVLVVGSAEGVFDEVSEMLQRIVDPVIFAVNDVGMHLPVIHHWFTHHSDKFAAWAAVRHVTQGKTLDEVITHSTQPDKSGQFTVRFLWEGLSPVYTFSGDAAMALAHILGAKLIVRCGCPGERRRRYFELRSTGMEYGHDRNTGRGVSASGGQQIIHEMRRLPEFKAKVRACSGWASEFYGKP